MIFLKRKQKTGLALIELLVSVTLFVILMISVTQIFQMVTLAQRQVIAVQNVQESLKYFFEVISKEIRMAKRNPNVGGCLNIDSGKLFKIIDNNLYLRNQYGECVRYFLTDERFQVERQGVAVPLSPAVIKVKELDFVVYEQENEQAYITIRVLAESVGREDEFSELLLQTTITSRNYRKN